MKVDRPRLIAEIRPLETEIKETKKQKLRPARELKRSVTLLYMIIAHSRGRLHLRKLTKSHANLQLPQLEVVTLEDQARIIGEHAQQYALSEEESERWAG